MLEVIYGIAVLITAYIALHAHCEHVQKVMFTLFCGWLVYVNCGHYVPHAERIELNLYLDMSQLGMVGLLNASWKNCATARLGLYVGACFGVMLAMHVGQLLVGFDLYSYYLACNMLFVMQLIAVAVYSRIGAREYWRQQQCQTPKHASESQHSKVVTLHSKSR